MQGAEAKTKNIHDRKLEWLPKSLRALYRDYQRPGPRHAYITKLFLEYLKTVHMKDGDYIICSDPSSNKISFPRAVISKKNNEPEKQLVLLDLMQSACSPEEINNHPLGRAIKFAYAQNPGAPLITMALPGIEELKNELDCWISSLPFNLQEKFPLPGRACNFLNNAIFAICAVPTYWFVSSVMTNWQMGKYYPENQLLLLPVFFVLSAADIVYGMMNAKIIYELFILKTVLNFKEIFLLGAVAKLSFMIDVPISYTLNIYSFYFLWNLVINRKDLSAQNKPIETENKILKIANNGYTKLSIAAIFFTFSYWQGESINSAAINSVRWLTFSLLANGLKQVADFEMPMRLFAKKIPHAYLGLGEKEGAKKLTP